MVLAELGGSIQKALSKLNASSEIDANVLSQVLKDIGRALLMSDVNVKLIKQLQNDVNRKVALDDTTTGASRIKLIRKAVYEGLVAMLKPERIPFKPKKGKCNVYMFVGLQGSGKTTTIAKFANYWKRKGWKVAMVCADTFRAGAFDQLKQNATRVRVPFYGSYTEADPVKIAEEGVAQFREDGYDIIIVDTSGRHKQESALFEEMEEVEHVVGPDEIVFVLDSTIGQSAVDQAEAFASAVPVGSVIMTKMDGHAKGGGALSAVAATGSPIIFIGTGEHFDAFDPFEASGFVSRLLGMGDLKGLMNEMVDDKFLEKQPELMNRMRKGLFTLRDMYNQLESIQKLGPLDRVMSMIPGLDNMIPKGREKEGALQMKRFMYMMDSMTNDELDNKVILTESRMIRICRGSGTDITELLTMLSQYKKMSQMVSKLGKSKLLNQKTGAMNKMMKNDPNAMMKEMAKGMNPQMLKQMGGAGGMMKMMEQMGGVGGLGEMMSGGMDMGKMAEMMKGMGGLGGTKKKYIRGRR